MAVHRRPPVAGPPAELSRLRLTRCRTGWRRSRAAGGRGYGDVLVRRTAARTALLSGQAERSAGDPTGVASTSPHTGFD
jgi:hypothetical protein